MNKRPFACSTQRNSVNSSFSTLKNCQFSSFYDTSHKQAQAKRFSYQEINSNQQSLQKQNMRINSIEAQEINCLNHQNKSALFIALQNSDDPMYLCERCAIMVASKGFQISKIQERKMKKPNLQESDFKKEANDAFTQLKIKKSQNIDKLNIFSNKLDKKIEFIQSYFTSLQEFIDNQKSIFLREVMLRKKQIQNLRQQSNSFHLNLLQRVRQINKESGTLNQYQMSEFSRQLKQLKKNNFEIMYQQLKYPLKLTNINKVCQEISCLIRHEDYKFSEVDIQFEPRCEQQNSEIRSLQLSFEQENNFTLNAQQTNRTGEL